MYVKYIMYKKSPEYFPIALNIDYSLITSFDSTYFFYNVIIIDFRYYLNFQKMLNSKKNYNFNNFN